MEFGCDVSLTVRLNHSVTVRHEKVDIHGTGLFQKSGLWLGVGVWGRCMGLMGFWIELETGSDLMVNARFCLV